MKFKALEQENTRQKQPMNIKIMLLILAFSCISCETAKNAGEEIVNVNIANNINNYKEIELSNLIENIIYIPLETSPDIILRLIKNIEFLNDTILISDSESCFIFSNEGKCITKIGRKGNGYGEYNHIKNVKIDTNREIWVQDGSRLILYNFKGRFVKELCLPKKLDNHLIVENWSFIWNNYIFGHVPNYSGDENLKALIFNPYTPDKYESIYPNYIFFPRKMKYMTSDDNEVNIYLYNHKFIFKEMMNDTLFHLNCEYNLIPKYVFNLGKYKCPTKKRSQDMMEYFSGRNNYIFIRNIYETNKIIFLDCDLGSLSRVTKLKYYFALNQTISSKPGTLGIYFKSENTVVFSQPDNREDVANPTGLKNDIDNGPNFFPKKILNDSTIISWVDAYQLKTHVASEAFKNSTPKYPDKKKALEKLANGLNENDNPVLVMVKLKE